MIETVWAASALILAVIALRALLGGKVSARVLYALWLPVLLRLLLPCSLPVSGISIVRTDTLHSAESALSEPLRSAPASAERVPVPVASKRTASGTGSITMVPQTIPAPPPVTRRDILRFLWYLGMLAVGGAVVASNLRFWLRLRRTRQRMDIDAPCPVYLAEGLPSPCLYGRTVYLPAPLEGETLRHVLAHELTHRRHGDPLWAVLTSACLTVYWFHPLVWAAAVLSRRDCELACDEGALAALGPQERLAYGRTLLALVGTRRPSDLLCCATMMGKSTMGARIRRIAEQPRTRAAALLALAAGIVLACAVSYTSPDRCISREVQAAVAEGCQADDPTERAAWQQLRDEILPAYRKAIAAHEEGPVLMEAVQLRRSRLGLAMGREYTSLAWELWPEHSLCDETLAAAGLHQWEKREWALWAASVCEWRDADGNTGLTVEDTYYTELNRERGELRWTELELYIPSDDFSEVARTFMTEIGRMYQSAASHNSGGVTDFEIVRAEVFDTLPDDRDHFAFHADFRFTPVDFPNAHWMAGGGTDQNPDGTISYSTDIALARNADNVWRVTSNGAAVRADSSGDTGWYQHADENIPDTLRTTSTEWDDIAREFLEQYGEQLRRLCGQGNLNGAQSVEFSHICTHSLDATNLEQTGLLPAAHPYGFYVTACADVLPPAQVMPWVWYDIWDSGEPLEDGWLRFQIGLALWWERDKWRGQFLDPDDVSPVMLLFGEPDSPDGRWKLSVGWASADDSQLMLTLHDAKTGKVRWEEVGYEKQVALWSPDSRYVALNRTARQITDTLVIDTVDFSEQVIPQPDPPEDVEFPAQQGMEALEWLDGRTLRCRASWYGSSGGEPVTLEWIAAVAEKEPVP